jgi:hypothetical protein
MIEDSVSSGANATFGFWMKAPYSGGNFSEYFTPLAEGITWLTDIGLKYDLSVTPPQFTWQMTSQYAFTDETKTVQKNMANMAPGERAYVGFTAKNTSNLTWRNSGASPLLLGTFNPCERRSNFSTDSNWLSVTRPTILKEASVAPGETGTFEFWMTAPQNANGVYNERLALVLEGVRWLNDTGLSYYANVHN